MTNTWPRRLAILVTATGMLCAATSPASAEPGDGPLVQTSCSYPQLEAALQVEAPDLSARLAQNAEAQTKLQAFFALPVDQRKLRIQQKLAENPDWQAKIDAKRNTPEGQEKVQLARRIADTCHNY